MRASRRPPAVVRVLLVAQGLAPPAEVEAGAAVTVEAGVVGLPRVAVAAGGAAARPTRAVPRLLLPRPRLLLEA